MKKKKDEEKKRRCLISENKDHLFDFRKFFVNPNFARIFTGRVWYGYASLDYADLLLAFFFQSSHFQLLSSVLFSAQFILLWATSASKIVLKSESEGLQGNRTF